MQLHGLNSVQIEMCTQIWSMDTEEELLEWFYALPDSLKLDAHAMINLMMFEEIDRVVDQQSPSDMLQSQEVLSRF